MDAMLSSMKLHIQYIRSLEDSERVRRACLTYIRNWSAAFNPEREDIFDELQALANDVGGHIVFPGLRWKYAWMRPIFGQQTAWRAQLMLPRFKARALCSWDRWMEGLERRRGQTGSLSVGENQAGS
jgi:hypothetical protein